MKVGFDLDDTIYAYPDIFRVLVLSLDDAGCRIYCTSNHSKEQFETEDTPRLEALDIYPSVFDTSLMSDKLGLGEDGIKRKAKMADQCDVVFDDHADLFQHLTKTPIFKVPVKK